VPTQRSVPAAERFMNASSSGLRAAWCRPMRLGSTLERALVFSSPQMPIDASIFSYSKTWIGLRNFSCASEPCLRKISSSSSGTIRTSGWPPAATTLR